MPSKGLPFRMPGSWHTVAMTDLLHTLRMHLILGKPW